MKPILNDLNPAELRARVEGLPLEHLKLGRDLWRAWLLLMAWGSVLSILMTAAIWISTLGLPASRLPVYARVGLMAVGCAAVILIIVAKYRLEYRQNAQQSKEWGATEGYGWLNGGHLFTISAGTAVWIISLPEFFFMFWAMHAIKETWRCFVPTLLLFNAMFLWAGSADVWIALVTLTRGHRKARSKKTRETRLGSWLSGWLGRKRAA